MDVAGHERELAAADAEKRVAPAVDAVAVHAGHRADARQVEVPLHEGDGQGAARLQRRVTQHEDLRRLLLATGDATLVEHTGNDHYWGDGGDGSGRNMLGRILMQVREELKRAGAG